MAFQGTPEEKVKKYLGVLAKRHRAWVSRTGKKGAKWRPRKLHRAAACKWLCNLDKQYRFYSGKKGFVHFKPQWGSKLWDNWRTMPRAVIGMDFGSDGLSGLHAGQYRQQWKLSLEGFPDQSHQENRAVYNMLRGVGLYGLVLLYVVSCNVPHGPDCEDLRYRQIKEHTTWLYKNAKPEQVELFMQCLPKLVAALKAMGVEFSSDNIAQQVWDFMSNRQVFAKQGSKTCMVRFQAVSSMLRTVSSFVFGLVVFLYPLTTPTYLTYLSHSPYLPTCHTHLPCPLTHLPYPLTHLPYPLTIPTYPLAHKHHTQRMCEEEFA